MLIHVSEWACLVAKRFHCNNTSHPSKWSMKIMKLTLFWQEKDCIYKVAPTRIDLGTCLVGSDSEVGE